MKKIFSALIISCAVCSFLLAGQWKFKGYLNEARKEFASVILNDGRVLVAGGYGVWWPGKLSSCEIYDPEAETWAITDSMNLRRTDFTLTRLTNGKILAVGGNCASASSEIYDPETETWGELIPTHFHHYEHCAISLNTGKVLIIGGDIENNYRGCEIYDPESESWTITGFCIFPKYSHTCVLLANGQVMAIGGDGPGARQKTEIYDPEAETWAEIDDLLKPRYDHTAHVINGNNVIAISGESQFEPTASCEIYDFATEQWSFTDSMQIARSCFRSEKLLNGKIIAMGGIGQGSFDTSEIYDSGKWKMAEPLYSAYYNFSSEVLNDERVIVMMGCYEIYTWNYASVSELTGPEQGLAGEVITFSVTASDPDADSVSVRIDWGDGEISGWTELQLSPLQFEMSHTWDETGQYEIQVQSADHWHFINPQCHNSVSEWSEPFIITINPTSISIGPDPFVNPKAQISIHPNPFKTSTTISLSVPAHCKPITISIFNIKGQIIKTLVSNNSFVWNGKDEAGKNLASGVYFCRINSSGKFSTIQKIILLK